MSRITVAQVNTRVDALVEAIATQNEILGKLVAQFSTPAPVIDLVEHKAARTSVPVSKTEPKTVSLKAAQKRVDAGEDAWKITVKSSNGNPVPFGLVLRAQRASERKANNATKPATPASAKNPYFAMSKAQLLADSGVDAQIELARREAKRNSK